MIVTFCGHREVYEYEKVKAWLESVVDELIQQGAAQFYLGGYGQFDALAALVVSDFKDRYKHIRSVLVLPYLDRSFFAEAYDETIYPSLEKVPKRFAISKRNEYMVDASDVVVAYVRRSYGGAYGTLQYAKRKRKRVIAYEE